MVAAYTRRLGAGSYLPPGETVLFTATDAHVWVVRDIVLTNFYPAPQFVQVFVRAGTSIFPLLVFAELAATTSAHLELRQEILPGEELLVYSVNGSIGIAVTGYAFEP